jgi:DNA-binding protein Fis
VLIPDFLPSFARLDQELEKRQTALPRSLDLARYVEERLHAGSENVHTEAVEFMEKYVLTRVLEETDGNQSQAAKILGITRGSLRNKLRSLGISIEQVVNITEDGQLSISRFA